ncbi:MAG: ABC transporter permease [Polyangiaceae bacterium]
MTPTKHTNTPLWLVLSMAFRQLRARPGLTAVASLGVALGVLALVVTAALLWGAKLQFEAVILKVSPDVTVRDEVEADSRSLWERAEGSNAPMVELHHASPSNHTGRIKAPDEFMDALRAWPDVAAVAPVVSETVLLRFGTTTRPVELRGIRLAEEERVRPLSTLVLQGDWSSIGGNGHRAGIGSGMARQLGLSIGDAISVSSAAGISERLEVGAIFESRVVAIDDSRIYVDIRTAQRLFGEPDIIRQVSIRLHDPERADIVANQISKEFNYRARSWQAQNANFLSLLAVQRRIGSVIMAGVVILSAFGILAVQIMVVMQKRRDIAILRAVGFQRGDILRLFLAYGMFMAVVGGSVGAGAGKLIIVVIKNMRVHMEGVMRGDSINVADVFPVYAVGVGFAVGAGLLASLLPAMSASRVEPVAVLRDQLA